MVGLEGNLDGGKDEALPRPTTKPGLRETDNPKDNDAYFKATRQQLPNELPAAFGGARETKITSRGVSAFKLTPDADNKAQLALAGKRERAKPHPVPELEEFGEKFARDLSARIRERGINSLGDIIKEHTEALKLPGEKPWEVIHSVIPAIADQIRKDFGGKIKVKEGGTGGIIFREIDPRNGQANEIKYHSSGKKSYEEKFRSDGSTAELRMFNRGAFGDRETPEWVEKYFPRSMRTPRALLRDKETQSRTDYSEDGTTKLKECIHESIASYEATTTIYNRDGSKFAEINRDLYMEPDWRRGLPDEKKEREPFSLKLYGSNSTSMTLDADGLREMQGQFKTAGKAPEGIAVDKLSEHLQSFVDTLPVQKTKEAARKLVRAISAQIEKGGIRSLEKVIKEHGAKLIELADTPGSDITLGRVASAISREVENKFKDIKVLKTDYGYEFRQVDPKTKNIQSISYFADGPISREAVLDEHGKVINEKLFIPRK